MNNDIFELNTKVIAANAIIEAVKYKINRLSFKDISYYCVEVASEYARIADFDVMTNFKTCDMHNLVEENKDLLMIEKNSRSKYIKLRDEADIQELKNRFRYNLSHMMIKVIHSIDIRDIIES